MPHKGDSPYRDSSGKLVSPPNRGNFAATQRISGPSSGFKRPSALGTGGLRHPGAPGFQSGLTGGTPNPRGSGPRQQDINFRTGTTASGGKPRAPHGGGQRPSMSRRALTNLRKKQKRK